MDIVEFYPSISQKLLEKALDWASTIVSENPVTKVHKEIILHSRKSLLFSNSENGEKTPWTKENGEFDVTMGAPDGAETCEIVGLFLLKEVKENFPELDFGLYRDDGLATHDEMSEGENERTRQGLKKLFNEHDLRITFEAPNLTTVNFLDVTLNLSTGKFSPYRKPNDEIKYVNAKSNHPPNVIRGIPKAVNKRLSAISSTQKEFDEAKEPYQEALNASGYQHHLEFEEQEQRTAKKSRRRRQILWYNPPWNEAVTTNIGKKFLTLLDKHFPKANQLHPLLNRNTVKISYSCTKNIKATIQAHNAKTISTSTTSDTTSTSKKCNCQRQKKDKCPLRGNCYGQTNVVYRAKVLDTGKEYIGSTVDFKTRFYSHNDSFKKESNRNATTLSTHIWEENLNPEPKIEWSIVAKASAYKKGNRQCDLCLTEKIHIMNNFSNPASLNKRTELAAKCRHKERHLLDPPGRTRAAV